MLRATLTFLSLFRSKGAQGAEGPAHYPQDVAVVNSHATEGTCRTCVTAGRFSDKRTSLVSRPKHVTNEARPAAPVLAGG